MKLIIGVTLAIVTAIAETIGAVGAGKLWGAGNRLTWLAVCLLGYAGSITAYTLMRRFFPDLIIGQGLFIAGTALFAVIYAWIFNRSSINLLVVGGLTLVAVGTILIFKALPE